MANTLKILYWIRKNKANREGLAPLIVRISYLNTRVERSTGHYIKPAEWNVTRQRVKGENDSATRINTWINHAL
jgi:hypothetical protein